jgi:hypothetical protein
MISPCSSLEITSHGKEDSLRTFTFSFFDNGTLVQVNNPLFGNPDEDGDTLNDVGENAAMNELSPRFILDRNEEFFTHPEDKVVVFGRSTPFPSPDNPRYIWFWYVVTWSRDYGIYGIGAHNGDTEPFIMVWKIVDNQTLALDSVYVHAHEGCNERKDVWNATGISCNYAGACDFTFREITKKPICSSLEFFDNRLLLYSSKNKHALFPSRESCQSSVLIEPSWNMNWTDPPGSMLNAAGSIAEGFWQMSFHLTGNVNIFSSDFNRTYRFSDVFMNYTTVLPVTEECSISNGEPLRLPVINTGEPDHMFITNLTGQGFSGEPVHGKECGNRVRFYGGLACDGKGATPVYTWLEQFPEILAQRLR